MTNGKVGTTKQPRKRLQTKKSGEGDESDEIGRKKKGWYRLLILISTTLVTKSV
jgi:hypothetical protein